MNQIEFVSVIIPTYNRFQVLRLALDAILNQSISTDNYEVIIVDDCSIDETESQCREQLKNEKNIIYIRNETNRGLATTRNIGIKASRGSLLIFLDNDLIACNDYIKAHIDCHNQLKEEDIAVVSDITYEPSFLEGTNFGRYMQSRCIGYRTKKNMVNINLKDLEARFFAGGGSSCRRENAFKIGLFDESLKKYGSEDELFGHRLKSLGVRIIYEPRAKLIHHDPNIGPKFWKIKFTELGRYSIKSLYEKDEQYLSTTKINLLLPINIKKDRLITLLKKWILVFLCSAIFRKPVEYFIFKTDKYPLFSAELLYQYITAAWVKFGLTSKKRIDKVSY